MKEAVILSAVRTPVGRFQGSLKPFSATSMGALVVKEAVKRSGLVIDQVDEVIMGNVVSAGLGQNPARQAALEGGLTPEVAALTINKVCGSGLKAVGLASQSIQTENSDIIVAGGMESMSNCPYLLPKARDGYRLGNGKIVDSMINDGLWDAYENFHMGNTGEIIADKYQVDRERQDEYALASHQKALAAIKAGYLTDQILSVEVPQKKGTPLVFDTDECPRANTSLEALRALKPAFKKDGTVTAGNSPGVNDGAAALTLTSLDNAATLNLNPIAMITGQAVAGIEPSLVMMAPVKAVRKLVDKVGWNLADVDLIELNEAFSVQALAVVQALELDPTKVNVNGGAVAIGHPIGATGARILVTLLYEMIRRDVKRGIATLCLGGGEAVALAVER